MLARREIPTNSSSVFSNFPRKRCFDEFSYLSSGQLRQNPRALIDAYGSEKRQETSWMNTEEEEFNWEDMIPTPSIGFSSEMPVTVAASATSSVSRVQPCPPVLPATFETRPSVNVHARRPPIYPSSNPVRNPFESINANTTTVCHGLINRPIPVHERGVENNGQTPPTSKRNLHQLPNQLPGLIISNPPTSGQTPPFQFFPSQNPAASQFTYRTTLPRHAPLPNARPIMPLPMPDQRIGNNSLRPLPPAGPHALPRILPHPNPSPNVSSQQPTVGYSNLISSLMAQGVISLVNQAPADVTKSANQSPAEDFIGLEFDPNILKVRHESVIRALYGDLPRQCTTCGRRFKSQDEHRSHMDWHVTKNRMSKNQKQKPSRKWFMSETMWLKGAETLGVKSAPGFLPTETTEEKKEDEELAVPADEDQNTCALCGEPFDVFYSDETEDWMCRGVVYLNASNGITTGMDRSQLGPIIHAKCRS